MSESNQSWHTRARTSSTSSSSGGDFIGSILANTNASTGGSTLHTSDSISSNLNDEIQQADQDTIVANLRTQLRQSETERIHQKQRYDFNLVFTKRLEAENWTMREKIEELEQERQRAHEYAEEARTTIEAHKQLIASLESTLQTQQHESSQHREEYENIRVMLELERQAKKKQQHEIDKLQNSLQAASQTRIASNKLYFREGIEEMRKILGNLKYQRELQQENTKIVLMESEKQELLSQLKQNEQTIQEQQRILNELQAEHMEKFGTGGVGHTRFLSSIGGEIRRSTRFDETANTTSTAAASSNINPSTSSSDASSSDTLQLPITTKPRSDSLFAELAEEEDEENMTLATSAESENLLAQLERAEERIRELTGKMIQAEEEADSQKTRREHDIAALQQQLSTLQSEYDTLQSKHAHDQSTHQSELDAVRKSMKEMEEKTRKDLETMKADHASTLSSLESSHTTALQQLTQQHALTLSTALAKAVEDAQAQHAAQLELLARQHASALEVTCTKADEEMNVLNEKIKELETQLRGEKEKNQEQQLALTYSSSQLATLQSELTTLRAQLTSLQTQLSQSESTRKSHVCQIPSSASEALEVQKQAWMKEKEWREECEKGMKELAEKLRLKELELTEEKKKLENAISTHASQLSSSNSLLTTLQSDLASTRSQILSLQSQLQSSQNTNSTLDQAIRTLKLSNERLQEELTHLQAQLDSATHDSEEHAAHLTRLIDTWKSAAESGRNVIDGVRKQHQAEKEEWEERWKEVERKLKELEEWKSSHVCGINSTSIAPSLSTPITPSLSFTSPVSRLKSTPRTSPSYTRESSIASLADLTLGGGIGSGSLMQSPSAAAAATNVVSPSSIISTSPALPYTHSQLLELHAYGTFISAALGGDADLKHIFPLDLKPTSDVDFTYSPTARSRTEGHATTSHPPPMHPTHLHPHPHHSHTHSNEFDSSEDAHLNSTAGFGLDLLRKLKDGLLLAKLINYVAPRTIDERVLNKRTTTTGVSGLGWKAIVENLNVCITSAKSLGLTMRVPHDLSASATATGTVTGEVDTVTGEVKPMIGHRRQLSVVKDSEGDEQASESSAAATGTSSSSTTTTTTTSTPAFNYIGIELGTSQMLLMSADSSLENVDILLDFLFQLLKTRLVQALFGPERRKMERLQSMLVMPKLSEERKRQMVSKTKSLNQQAAQTPGSANSDMSPQTPSSPSPASLLMSPRTALSRRNSASQHTRNKMSISKYSTLNKSLPSNLSAVEHKRFVTHFTQTVLANYDATNELVAMTPEQLLLRWINWNMMKYSVELEGQEKDGSSSPLTTLFQSRIHFVAHISDIDIHVYHLLITIIDSWRIEKGVISDDSSCFNTIYSLDELSVQKILSYFSSSLNIRHFHTNDSILMQHHRLNLLLVGLIFQKWPMMDDACGSPTPSPVAVAVTSPIAVAMSNVPSAIESNVTTVAPITTSSTTVASTTTAAPPASSPPRLTNRLSFSIESGMLPTGLISSLNAVSGGDCSPDSFDGLTDEERESTLLKSFLNSSGIPHIHINNLFNDMRSGLILLRFIDYLEPGCVDWKMAEQAPSNKFKCISNLNLFLRISQSTLHLAFVNVGAVDIYSDNNTKYCLSIMWQLLRYHTLQKLKEIRGRMMRSGSGTSDGAAAGKSASSSKVKDITDASILEWANGVVSANPHPIATQHSSASITSFQDHNLKSSLFLLNLLSNLKEGCVDWSLVEIPEGTSSSSSSSSAAGTDISLLLRNASYTISIARKLGAELFALPYDIVTINRKVILLICASLMALDDENGWTDAHNPGPSSQHQ